MNYRFPQIIVVLVLGVWGCDTTSSQSLESNSRDKSPDAHAYMLDALRGIKDANVYENIYYGNSSVEDAEQKLKWTPKHFLQERFDLLSHIGRRRLWQGETEKAIEPLLAAHRLAESTEMMKGGREGALFQLAVAYLRLGENENCVNCNNGDSCLFPIQNAGIHNNQTGSRAATTYLNKLLHRHPEHVAARWLLNIACMTLGEYPDRVPAEFLIEPDQFKAEVDFPRFRNVASERGVSTLSLSGGCIVDDFDGDGDLDVIASSWGLADQLRYFRNDRGRFTDVTQDANLTGLYGGLNLIQADYDNDNDLDVYVMRGAWMGEAGRFPNSLLQNDGSGRFRDVTFESGMTAHYPSQAAAWLDFDNDGDLDLYVGNENYPSQLFQNDGTGQFVDVALIAQVQNNGFTKGCSAGDFNDDGYPDIYVSNHGGKNRLFRNNRNGTFTDVAEDLQVTGPEMSLPVWFWDYNQDGVLDIFVASYSDGQGYVSDRYFARPQESELDCLYEGDGKGGFQDVARKRNLKTITQAMGSNFGDLDNDGYPDFYLGTGYPEYEGLMPNLMYWNQAGQNFADVTTAGGFGHLQKGHAVAFADIDNDGDQDVFQEMGGAFPGDRAANCLYLNPGFGNHWIKIKLIGNKSNRSAIGARITAEINDAGQRRSIFTWVNSGGSFGASPLRQEVGLGKATRIERLKIYWPTSNQTQEFLNVSADQSIVIVEGQRRFLKMPLSSDLPP